MDPVSIAKAALAEVGVDTYVVADDGALAAVDLMAVHPHVALNAARIAWRTPDMALDEYVSHLKSVYPLLSKRYDLWLATHGVVV